VKAPSLSKTYSQRLKQAMDAAEYDEFAVAGALHCDRRTVENWLTGRQFPRKTQEVHLADLLGVSLDWLSGRDSFTK
jgi:transcriptional regulator with XRE-family HTH domain